MTQNRLSDFLLEKVQVQTFKVKATNEETPLFGEVSFSFDPRRLEIYGGIDSRSNGDGTFTVTVPTIRLTKIKEADHRLLTDRITGEQK